LRRCRRESPSSSLRSVPWRSLNRCSRRQPRGFKNSLIISKNLRCELGGFGSGRYSGVGSDGGERVYARYRPAPPATEHRGRKSRLWRTDMEQHGNGGRSRVEGPPLLTDHIRTASPHPLPVASTILSLPSPQGGEEDFPKKFRNFLNVRDPKIFEIDPMKGGSIHRTRLIGSPPKPGASLWPRRTLPPLKVGRSRGAPDQPSGRDLVYKPQECWRLAQ